MKRPSPTTPPFYLKQVEVGMMRNFSYLIGDPTTHVCACVDPAWDVARLLNIAASDGYRITKILLTHGHHDHANGVADLVRATDATVFVNPLDDASVRGSAKKIENAGAGIELKIGALKVVTLHTPGHTPGSNCYLVEDLCLFTGDTLFQGNCGRADLAGSNPRHLYSSLRTLARLDPQTNVYPGHDYGSFPVSTIEYEKANNPTILAASFDDFVKIP